MVCNKNFKRITEGHLNKHGITCREYVEEYPNVDLVSQESKLAYSNGTKKYFEAHKEEAKRRAKSRIISLEGSLKRSKEMKQRWKENKDQFITVERNNKVSKAKKEWWSNKSSEERSEFIKQKVVTKTRKNLGEEAYKAQLREKGIKGYQTLVKKGTEKILNNFEQEMIATLEQQGFKCIPQFEIDKWYYDCFIPEKNLIVEFDGDYWHPKTLVECNNTRLKRQWNIDRKKERIAREKGFNLVRVRESEKHLLLNLI